MKSQSTASFIAQRVRAIGGIGVLSFAMLAGSAGAASAAGNNVNSISVPECFVGGMSGTLDVTVASSPFEFDIWVTDHIPGEGFWVEIPGSRVTLSIDASDAAYAFGPLNVSQHRDGVNSYRVETDGGSAKSASIHPCDGPTPTPTPEVTPTPTPEVSPTPTPTPDVTPTPTPEVTPTPQVTPTPEVTPSPTPEGSELPASSELPSPSGGVSAATGTPSVTLPPTDTLSDDAGDASVGPSMLVIAGLLGAVAVVAAIAGRRPTRARS